MESDGYVDEEIDGMKCPACERDMSAKTVGDVSVDVCEGGCGGIWFDPFELKKFDEPHEAAGTALLDIERDPGITVDHTQEMSCPKCRDTIMAQHFFSTKRAVEVDECPACGSYWLDIGDLAQIRNLYGSDEERRAAAGEYFEDVFGEGLAKMRAESDEQLARARRVAHMFRFICPSYYMSGRQEWGAF